MIANKIREKLNCDILEIKTVIPYDEIILGTLVWWYRPVPAIRTF